MNNALTKLLLLAGFLAASANASAFYCDFEKNEWGVWVPSEDCTLEMLKVDAELVAELNQRYWLKLPNLIARKLKASPNSGAMDIIARSKNIGTGSNSLDYQIDMDLSVFDDNGTRVARYSLSGVEQRSMAPGAGEDLYLDTVPRPNHAAILNAVIRVDTVNMSSGGQVVESNETDNSMTFRCQIPSEDYQEWILSEPHLPPCF